MSYTNNHTNSSIKSGSNDFLTPTPGAINSATVEALITGISNVFETQSDSDSDEEEEDDDIVWSSSVQPVVKYDLENLKTLLEKMDNKMDSISKNIQLIIQREALLAQTSKTSRKRRRKKSAAIAENQPTL